MDAVSITKAITRAVLVSMVLAVFTFSILLAPEINATSLSVAMVKSLLTLVFGWIFILILSDTIVKSIVASALESRSSRKEGGFIYHFLKPDQGEIKEEDTTSSKNKKVAK